jgi:GNAT superfamily N-acetyltransferase
MSLSTEVQVRVVPRDEQVAALWLLFGADPEAVRRERVTASVRAAIQGTVDFDHLLEARRGVARVGVVWGQPLPGRNANVWPPYLESGEPESTSDQLQATLDDRLTRAGLATAQSLLRHSDTNAANCLSRNAYADVASLLYLLCGSDQFPAERPAVHLDFTPYREDELPRLAAVIEATYVGTCDIPVLDGVRDTRDVIDGYKATGRFAPERWFFVRGDDTDVGCLLLTDHTELRNWELIYMGLVPAARGNRWGVDIVRFAQWQAKQAACESLLVSVDAANGPAVAAFFRCGFSEIDRRQVWVKKLPDLR